MIRIKDAHYRTWTDNPLGTNFKSVVFACFTKWARDVAHLL